MRKDSYKKLVRDRIPEIIKENGERPVTRTLRKKEFQDALKEKLLEETKELQKAKGREELINELADIQEVMLAMYETFDIECGDVTHVARKKRKERGGFSKGIFLEDVR